MARQKSKHSPESKDEASALKHVRRLRLGGYKSFRLQRTRIKPVVEDRGIPGGFKIFRRSFRLLLRHWKFFGGILLIYALINIALAGGVVNIDSLLQNNATLNAEVTGSSSGGVLKGGLTLLTLIAKTGGGNSLSDSTSAYQIFILVVSTLALIWGLRQVYAGKPTHIKMAFYNGVAPMIPFLLVLVVLVLELLPFVAGSDFMITLIGNQIAITWLEQSLAVIVFFLSTLLSLYWVTGSVFALYIVTLPNMTPIEALRSASELVRYRRGTVLLRWISFLLVIVLLAVFLIVPVILTFPGAASAVFYVGFVLVLGAGHSYMYALYRELVG